MADLILASASPRRSQLLDEAGITYEVVPADIDETARSGEGAAEYVERLARAKAEHVASLRHGTVVLGADTIVTIDGELLGKPVDADDAIVMLQRLSGRTHVVMTGVAVAQSEHNTVSAVETSRVTFRSLGRREIETYVATGEPLDKAGSYAIQGGGGSLVAGISGAFDNIVGLPIAVVRELLNGRW